MTIELNDAPEGKYNKVRWTGTTAKREGLAGAGLRYLLLARHTNKKEAIGIIMSGPLWGRIVKVREGNPNEWPTTDGTTISAIPNSPEWFVEVDPRGPQAPAL